MGDSACNIPALKETNRYVVIDQEILNATFRDVPQHARESIQNSVTTVVSTLFLTARDVERIVRDVASELNYRLSGEDAQLVTRQLLTNHLDAAYIRERVEDILADDVEETLCEMWDELRC